MIEGRATMTCEVFVEPKTLYGLPAVAVRLGRALENWGRRAARIVDRETLRREYERQRHNEARMLGNERFTLPRW